MPIKMSVHRLALQHGSSRMHCHKGDLSGYLYHAHCHGNRNSYEMQTLRTEVFVLSCLSHTHSFLPPNPGAFMDGLIVRRPSVSQQLEWSPKTLGSLGQLVQCLLECAWILQSCRDPPATGAPPPKCLATPGSAGKSFSNS